MSSPLELRFASNNERKLAEAQLILGAAGILVIPARLKIDELQTSDTEKLVRDKLFKAFRDIARPLFVEHTGLALEHLNGLPGGLTQTFWDALLADRFADLFGTPANKKATAITTIAYCDGRKVHEFSGRIDGEIVQPPRGPRDFQWDCVFQPAGDSQTFAEMGDRKNEISMRRKALNALATFLTKGRAP
jgi:XTP/dITP diphosphohydrolase